MSETFNWKLDEEDGIWWATNNGNYYEVYETAPGFQRVRRNSILIAETYTTEEGKRWAESYDDWIEFAIPKLPPAPPSRPRPLPLPIPENESEADRLVREKADMKALLRSLDCTPISAADSLDDYRRFPRYPIDFCFAEEWITRMSNDIKNADEDAAMGKDLTS